MSATKDKLRKRKPRKVEIDGDVFFVRSMTIAEVEHVDVLAANPQRNAEIIGYSLTRCVVEESGENVFDVETTATDGSVQFDPVIKEIPIDVAMKLSQEIRNATQPASIDTAKKN